MAGMKTNDEVRRENLLLAIKRLGSAKRLADAVDTAPAYISQLKTGAPDSKTGKAKTMGDELARRIEVAIGEQNGWMDTDRSGGGMDYLSNVFPIHSADNEDYGFVQIPMVKLRLSAGMTGFQTEPDQRGGGTVGMRRDWIERSGYNPNQLVAVRIKGESMVPSLYEDDIVVINTADKAPVDGVAFAINYEGEAVVKRFSRDAGDWWLMSDHPDQRKYHRKVCRGDACIVIGRVVLKESKVI